VRFESAKVVPIETADPARGTASNFLRDENLEMPGLESFENHVLRIDVLRVLKIERNHGWIAVIAMFRIAYVLKSEPGAVATGLI
jgi:hypothetical protein